MLVIDARDPRVVTTRVAGLPLVCRHVRLAARAGHTELLILGDAATIGAALAERPPPPTVRVSVDDRAPREGEEVLPGLMVYTTKLAPFLALDGPDAAQEAERRLFTALRKSVTMDGVVSFYFMRPLSRLVTRLLLPTRVTPNQVTLLAMLCGIAAAVVAAGGGYLRGAVAGALFWLGAAIDCIDGELARLRVEGSRLGEWLDCLADDVSTMGLLFGLGLGLGVERGPPWPLLGTLGLVVGVATVVKIYSDLARLGLPIDSAQYPWFFGKASERSAPRGILGAVSYLFQRDAYATVVTVLLLCGARLAAFVALLGGVVVFAVLMVVHVLVGGRRP